MAEAKTKPTKQTVKDFISKLPDQQTRDNVLDSVSAQLER